LEADVHYNGDEIQRKLQTAIANLPDKQKAVFVMKYYEEKKYKEISEITGTSVGALKASFHHAVKKIEDFLKTD
jgi:RNA polymerase sigma-70 factor (ECF subfamily)